MLKINENVVAKFEEVTGLKLVEVQNTAHSFKLVSFDKFAVTDELNLKLLACQGITGEYVKLQSGRKTTEGKKVFLFMIKNNKVVKFYPAYVEKEQNTMPKIDTSIVSVVPTKSDNTRQKAHEISMSIANKAIADNQIVTRAEFDELKTNINLILANLVNQKTETKKGKK